MPDNRKRDTTRTSVNVEGRDSLDIEMAQKTAITVAALVGAKSFGNTKECLNELKEYIQFLSGDSFSNDSKKKYVILFLEGDFGTKTRTKKMIMKELQDSINKKLRWINCRVSVVDSDTYDLENISDCKVRFVGKDIGSRINCLYNQLGRKMGICCKLYLVNFLKMVK